MSRRQLTHNASAEHLIDNSQAEISTPSNPLGEKGTDDDKHSDYGGDGDDDDDGDDDNGFDGDDEGNEGDTADGDDGDDNAGGYGDGDDDCGDDGGDAAADHDDKVIDFIYYTNIFSFTFGLLVVTSKQCLRTY